MSALPDILLPYQSEAIRLAHEHQLLVVEKSRRIGLSYGVAPMAVLWAAAETGAENVYYVGYNIDMAREFIGYCADFAKAFNDVQIALPDEKPVMMDRDCDGWVEGSGNVSYDEEGGFLFHGGSTKGLKAFRVDFPSGKAVVALTSNPRSVRGKQGIFIIDEAAFHDDLEGLVKAVLAALMWGGRVIIISTHDGDDNFFNGLIGEIRAGKRLGHVLRITLKDAIAAGLYKRICLVSGKTWSNEAEEKWEADLRKTYGDAADEELDVIPARGRGTYIARPTIEAAQTAQYVVLRYNCPPGFENQALDWRADMIADWLQEEVAPRIAKLDPTKLTYFGQDFARSGDLSAIAVGQYDDMGDLHCPFILELRNMPFRQQKQVLAYIVENVPRFAAGKMDARGNGQQLAEEMQEDYGPDHVEAVMATVATYLAMMPRLKIRIEDRTLLMPKSEAVTDDLRCIKLVKGIPSIPDRSNDKEDGAKGKRHGDTAIALMHLVAAADEDVVEIEIHSAGERKTSGQMTETDYGSIRAELDDDFSIGASY